MNTKTVEIVVPIYKSELTEYEHISLRSCFRVLRDYPIVMCKPEGLDTKVLEERYPFTRIETFPAQYFASIADYNRLMLSPVFYERFLTNEFVLVCQTDVFLFRDDLKPWLSSDYDYVGAPWMYKNSMGRPLQWLKMVGVKWMGRQQDIIHKFEAKGRVGNGGFSLRRTKIHHQICLELKEDMERFLQDQDRFYFNEDLYWSIIPQRKGYSFRTPTAEAALSFAFDHSPAILLKRQKGELPMAAHGWFTRKNLPFWWSIIEEIDHR